MDNVIPLIRFVDVTGWSLKQIEQYIRDNGWTTFRLHWQTDDDRVRIERCAS